MSDENEEQLAWQAMEAGNFATAMQLLRPLAERNSQYALISLGWIYETGAIGAPDPAAARSFYDHAARLGSAEAYGHLGSLLLNQEEVERAELALKQGAALGDGTCQSLLESLIDNREEQRGYEAIEAGQFEDARRLLEPLAARGSAYASLALGWIYETGKLGAPDPTLAISCYQRAVTAGGSEAQRYLAKLLHKEGRKVDARTTFERGAEAGDISCMFWLGKLILEGEGGVSDRNLGRRWLEAAAAQGHLYARRKLLSLEQEEAPSIIKKLSVLGRSIALIPQVVREICKGPDSNKLW